MSCPTWSELAERRDAGGASDEWRKARQHFDRCPECRDEALAADPTLVFRRLPSTEVSEQEVEEMRAKVSWLRRTRELERSVAERPSRGRSWRWLARMAATLLLVGASTGIGLDSIDSSATRIAGFSDPASPSEIRLPASIAAQPVLEQVGRSADQVVEWTDTELSLVVLIEAELDV